jgi:hypothetical protein
MNTFLLVWNTLGINVRSKENDLQACMYVWYNNYVFKTKPSTCVEVFEHVSELSRIVLQR